MNLSANSSSLTPNVPFDRRRFLSHTGLGLGSVALSSLLAQDGLGAGAPDGLPHFPARVKSVIWLFMVGGTSHLESFDPKPELTKRAGQDLPKEILESPYATENLRRVVANQETRRTKIYPLQIGHRPRGESGLQMSDWWPHLASCADDLAVVRSMWTTDDNHGAQLQFHSGRHRLEGFYPTIGSWVHYGLGSLNDNLPQFVVLGTPLADCCGGTEGHRANYLGPQHDGVQLAVNPEDPLSFASPGKEVYREEQRREFELLGELNRMTAEAYPRDKAVEARIKSYELAFRMQSSVPDAVDFRGETAATRQLYGLDQKPTQPFGEQLLVARRLVERGVRFVQVFHGSTGGAGAWDQHSNLKTGHTKNCAAVDKPIAGLLKDLKQRGTLDETLVVWATEFGRSPGSQGANGRDHHPFGFSVWLAGGGIRGGVAHGATDPFGFHAIEDRHYVTDIHATLMHLLGLDPRRLVVPGRPRLDRDFGEPIREILA
ncbi:MAG: DUF1501 domain-containing protein [Planctomycetales bacterium]|nr:DUF1501 domain-containing protein [Planctomycetales bacterium]